MRHSLALIWPSEKIVFASGFCYDKKTAERPKEEAGLHTPQYRQHDTADKLVIFIHGFMGSPDQFDSLQEAVFNEGISCKSVLLPGHGGSTAAFIKSGAADWEQHVQNEIERVRERYSQIYLVGHSMGGLLALNASLQKENKIAGVFLLATPLKVNFSLKAAWARIRLLAYAKDHETKAAYLKAKSVSLNNPLYYPLLLKPSLQFYAVAHKARKNLPQVSVPVRMIHSKRDETVSANSGRLLLEGLTAAKTDAVALEQSWHAYYPENEQAVIRRKLIDFIS